MENKINPQVWDQGTPGRAHQGELVIIVLQDPTRFPNWKQYPLRREACEGLQPLINKFLACGLLVPTNSPCNTPILSVKKKDRSSQCTSPKHPGSCIELRLVIHFLHDIIHVSMPFPQIIPPSPSPSPTESKNCSIHLCLFCCLAYNLANGSRSPDHK